MTGTSLTCKHSSKKKKKRSLFLNGEVMLICLSHPEETTSLSPQFHHMDGRIQQLFFEAKPVWVLPGQEISWKSYENHLNFYDGRKSKQKKNIDIILSWYYHARRRKTAIAVDDSWSACSTANCKEVKLCHHRIHSSGIFLFSNVFRNFLIATFLIFCYNEEAAVKSCSWTDRLQKLSGPLWHG